ncbi:MAG: hypothetical protein MMC23_003675 [Stictis urceolatum]|nr:hypothetical protein [Stictis urceolata]
MSEAASPFSAPEAASVQAPAFVKVRAGSGVFLDVDLAQLESRVPANIRLGGAKPSRAVHLWGAGRLGPPGADVDVTHPQELTGLYIQVYGANPIVKCGYCRQALAAAEEKDEKGESPPRSYSRPVFDDYHAAQPPDSSRRSRSPDRSPPAGATRTGTRSGSRRSGVAPAADIGSQYLPLRRGT